MKLPRVLLWLLATPLAGAQNTTNATDTSDSTATSSTSGSATVTFPDKASVFSCETSSPGTPVRLPTINTANGPKIILLKPQLASSEAGDNAMCILSRWSLDDTAQEEGEGYYYPLGRSLPGVSGGDWRKPPGRPGRNLDYLCGEAENGGLEFSKGDYLCQVTLPQTKLLFPDYTYTPMLSPYYLTYYERNLSVRKEISRFLHKTTFGPTPEELDALEAAHATIMAGGMTSQEAMAQLQTEWIESQMDPSTFTSGTFSSLRKYWRQRVNARAFEVYRIGMAGPAPCEKNSRWRKFAFTNYDVQSARYLRWGDEGVTKQSQNPHKITVETIDLRAPTPNITSAPTPLPVASPTRKPVSLPTFSPTISSAPTGANILGYGDFELAPGNDTVSNTTDAIDSAWASSCQTELLDAETYPDDVYSGEYSYNVTGGRCMVLRMMGSNCASTRMPSQLTEGDVIKISLWVKVAEPSQVFQMYTAHYHARKTGRWARPLDDSHVISRTLVDNANKWKKIEAIHTVGPDWTFEGEVLAPKLCNHYQLRFNLAGSTSSYIMDEVRIERIGLANETFAEEERQVVFLRNPSFVSGHEMWKLATTSGTISYDSVLRQNVMSLKRGEVARQEISSSATPGASYSFGFWARLLNSDKAITLKVIIRMRFTNNDLIYGPCKNPICNLYERPVTATMAGGTSQWQHIIAETFEMYGNYTAWNGTADFILFQVLTAGMPHSAELRIANFHDLTESTVPPSMSMVPSTSPTTLNIEDVAYVISYAGDVRTVVYHPFQIDDTGEVLPMDGSVKYVLCEVEEVEGSLSESPKGMGFVVDDLCTRIRGGNPTVNLDPRYLDMASLHILDLSNTNSSVATINTDQTYGGDLLLLSDVQDEVCSTFPSPYDNDYRGTNTSLPNRFDPDENVFALLPDGTYAIYDPRIILQENTLENPLMDGGGETVLRSTLHAQTGYAAVESYEGSGDYIVANDQNIVLCANEHPNFLNRDNCVLSYDPNACTVEKPSYINEMQRHTFVNVQLTLKFDKATLAALHAATAFSSDANATSSISKRYIYAVSNLRYDETNTNGTYSLPCRSGNPMSRWIPREDLDATTCTNSLQASSTAALAHAIQSSNDQNPYLRDIYLWNSVAEDGCDPSDEMEYGMLVMTENEGCWQNVPPDHMNVYDFTKYVSEHPTSSTSDTSITGFANSGILAYPANHPMSYLEALKNVRISARKGAKPLLQPVARYGDMMIVDDFAKLVGINKDPVALKAVADLGEIRLNNVINKNRNGGTLVCGSINEVVPDPTLDDFFDVMHADLDCVGCQKSYGDYFSQKQTVWTINALESEDQFCGRMAWALYELVNVGTTTAPDNTESNLQTYDVFKRHCFGNYYDILKEMSYNPKMGEQFGFVMSTSTRFFHDKGGTYVYPDENYAREIMQLYTIGLHFLNEDGTDARDQFGRVVQTYTNRDILSNARIWSGFEYTARRGNVEELFRANKSRQDPMRIEIDKHDFLPKLTLGSWIGDRYPLCTDLPAQHFLKIGAQYHLRGGSSTPSFQSMSESWDADEAVKRFVLSPTSSLYNKLCNADDAGICQYANTVTIDENLPCEGKECRVETLVTVQVAPGVFYEYIRQPCVLPMFYKNPIKVVSGIDMTLDERNQYSHVMCADPKTTAAARSCCDADGKKMASYNYKFEYHGERVTAAKNEEICVADGLSVCDPNTVNAHAPLVLNKALYNFVYPSQNTFFWTGAACAQQVRIRADGMMTIVHDPVSNTNVFNEAVVPFVSLEKSVTYITMPWDQDVYTLDYLYPSSEENSCDNGACSTLEDGSCLCSVTVSESAVFDSLPTREEVLSNLYIGGFDPASYSDSSAPYSLVDSNSEVEAYSTGALGDASTIFKIINEQRETIYLKNTLVNITIGSSYTMRNPPTFINLPKVDELDAVYEVEAFMKFLMAHPNTPPFVSKKLIQYFGVSNPSPDYTFRVTQAFKEGSYSKNGVTFGDGTYGNLAAVSAAIALDPEALNVVLDDDPINGNVREPLLKVVQALRSLSFTRRSEVKISNGLLKDMPWKIGQMVFQPPDQFSFFSSDYSPPGIIYGLDMVSPESQLLSMSSVVGITNGFFSLFNFGLSNADGGFGPFMSTSRVVGDYSTSVGVVNYQVDGADIASKIDDLDVIMTGGRLSVENKQVLTDAYNYFIQAHDVETADRVLMGLVTASPEFHTTNTLKKTGAKRAVTPPAPKSSEPYKAIVYIYIAGGIDSFNILAPHSDSGCYLYDDYYSARGGVDGIGLTPDDMLTIDGSSAGIEGCPTFGVNKLMSSYKEIFDEGKGIFLANMGHLHKAVHKSNWMTETRTDLFSHHTMKREAQYADAFREGAGPGVLGRMCDILQSFGHAVSAISVNTQAPMVDGDPGLGRYADTMSTEGLPKIFERHFLNGRSGQELRMFLEDLNAATTSNSGIMANMWSQRFIDVWDKTDKLVSTMRGTALQTPFAQSGPDIDDINQQLKLVAQLIAARDKRGNGKNRDVFFVQMGGFDTHSEEAKILAGRLPALNQAVGNFWAEIKAQGLANSVTVIQGSEFGRTISTNSNGGTDHAWGGNYFMFGGDVAGGKILGEYPRSFDESDPTNIGRGRLIPTRAWDSMWYGVSQWFGIIEHADLSYVLPNNVNFGCDLFMDSDLFTSGTNRITGCGGPKIDAPVDMDISEARFLTGEEQKALCYITTQTVAKQLGLNAEESRCFIADQVVAPSANGPDMFTVSCIAKLSFDLNVPAEIVSAEKITSIMTVASNTASSRVVLGGIARTEAPSASPSTAPSISSAPTSETAPPTRAPVTPQGLPFSSSDIGYCAYKGESFETSDGLYNLKGSGADIWGTADGFHYMYVESSGDADFVALIENFSKDRHEWAKAGIMFRASLAKDAAHYTSLLTGNNGIANQWRRCPACISETRGTASINPSSIWMRITKVGAVMTAYYKEISSSYWVPHGLELSLPAISSNGYYVGLFVTSHDNQSPNMASLQVSNVDLFRKCESDIITVEQCDQATNCELGLRTSNCYDIGSIRTRKVKIQLPGTNYLHLAEVEVYDQYGENVALNKPATMSSVYDPNYFPYPADAVDGVIADSMFHTDIEKGPWWEVDLGDGLPEVAEIVVYNRNHDCDHQCQARANNAIISLIDSHGQVFDSRDLGVAASTVRRRAQTTYVPIGVPFTPVSIGTYQTRKVKIQLTTAGSLHLTEVQVFDDSGVNRALKRPATMSCVYSDNNGPYHSNPGEALDGITTGENMFHTCDQFGAWWEVDLGGGLVNVKKVVIYNRQDCPTCFGRLSFAKVSLIDANGEVFDYKNLGDTANIGLLNLDFGTTKKSVLPPKEYEPAGYFEYFGKGWCRDATEKMYDYLRFYVNGATPQVCQDKCIQHFSGLVGISTYSSSYCYCWFENGMLPSPLPSDVHGYSAKYAGKGEVTLTLNEQDGDCYKFYETIVDTQTPTTRPTPLPTNKPTAAPTEKPTQKPTAAPVATVEGDHVYLGDGWCKDSSFNYFDYLRFDPGYGLATLAICSALCPHTPGYRGLSTYSTSYCYCWYTNNQTPTDLTNANVYRYEGFAGTGHITQFEYNGYSACYKFNPKA